MNVMIIDDEPMPAKQLASLIKRNFPEITNSELFLSASEAMKRLKEQIFDIVFLDIEMPEMDGFEFLKRTVLPEETSIIFTTAYQEYAIDAFDADATHYLVKPISEPTLSNALEKVRTRVKKKSTKAPKQKRFSIFNDNEHHIIREEEVIRLEADGSYTKIILDNRTILSSKNLGLNAEKLSPELFFRSHKSHLVNLNRVTRLSKGKSGYVVLSNEDVVPLAATRQEALERAMGL